MSEILIEAVHLKKFFPTSRGTLHAVDDVSFSIEKGKTMGVVGESGMRKIHPGQNPCCSFMNLRKGRFFFVENR